MPFWTNYHSHCNYCDGSHEPEEYIKEAVNQRIKCYGFSSHAPLPFETPWAMPPEKLGRYLKETAFLKIKYQDLLQIYTGIEVDFIPGLISPHSDFIQQATLDYTIGSVHFVEQFGNGQFWEIDATAETFKKGLKEIFNNQPEAAIKQYYKLTRQMLKESPPTIVGHLDKIKMHNTKLKFFDEKESWYEKEVTKTLKALRKAGSILEVNTRGVYTGRTVEVYPSPKVLKRAADLEIPITLSSDAHQPTEVASLFAKTVPMLKKAGFKKLHILWDGQWQACTYHEKGIEI